MFLTVTIVCNLLAGVGLTLLGRWWCINILKRYFLSRANNTPFVNTAYYTSDDWPYIPAEPIIKYLGLLTYFGVEMFFVTTQEITPLCGSFQQIFGVIYAPVLWRFSMFLYTFVEVYHYYESSRERRLLPYISLALSAYLLVVLLPRFPRDIIYYNHMSDLASLVNYLHNASVYGLVWAAVLEMFRPESLVLGLTRSAFTIMIGLWLLVAAMMLDEAEVGKMAGWEALRNTGAVFTLISLFVAVYVGGSALKVMDWADEKHKTSSSICKTEPEQGMPSSSEMDRSKMASTVQSVP